MQTPKPADGKDQFVIRFPHGVRNRLKEVAAENRRSMNAELLLLIERGLAASGAKFKGNEG